MGHHETENVARDTINGARAERAPFLTDKITRPVRTAVICQITEGDLLFLKLDVTAAQSLLSIHKHAATVHEICLCLGDMLDREAVSRW